MNNSLIKKIIINNKTITHTHHTFYEYYMQLIIKKQIQNIDIMQQESCEIYQLPQFIFQCQSQIKYYKHNKLWTKQQKQKLLELHEKYGKQWQKIAEQLPGRTVHACHAMIPYLIKNTQIKRKKKVGKQFSHDEDILIMDLYKQYPEDWDKIAQYFQNRSPQTLENRYKFINQYDLTKINRIWTNEEDQKLTNVVQKFNFQWDQIAKQFPNCIANDCYQRYKRLNDGQKKWAIEQDNMLLKLFEKYDTNWQKISHQLGNKRNKNGCYHRFNKLKSIHSQKKWSDRQFQLLIQEYNIHQGNWTQIQQRLPKFNEKECYFKYYSNFRTKKRIHK